MNIIHVNNVDILGNRFNGYDMQRTLNPQGIDTKQFVMDRMSSDPNVLSIPHPSETPYFRKRVTACEAELSIHDMIYPYGWRLMDTPEFKAADIVHYHLLHNYFGALPLLPEMSKRKPSVLTVHDPWIFTGHCIYPINCKKWLSGCGNCDALDLVFPMKEDRTALMWEIKKDIYRAADLNLIVASHFMYDYVKKSPITAHMDHVYEIPFGIDTTLFSDKLERAEIRRKLGIPANDFVLFFRSDRSPYKGLQCIKDMLGQLRSIRPVTILTVVEKGNLESFKGQFNLMEYGWVTEDSFLAELYAACDVFLMPSTAEAFGLMAIETMASARPIIVCDGTSLPGVTFAPDCGISIPQNDARAMCAAVERLMVHPEECAKRGRRGRELAKEFYRYEDYVDRHIKLYEEILSRH